MIARVRVRDIPFEEMVTLTKECYRANPPSREGWDRARGTQMEILTHTAHRGTCGRVHWLVTERTLQRYGRGGNSMCESQLEVD